jgi:hypothetical protein
MDAKDREILSNLKEMIKKAIEGMVMEERVKCPGGEGVIKYAWNQWMKHNCPLPLFPLDL